MMIYYCREHCATTCLLGFLDVDRYIFSGEKIVPPGAKRGLIPVVVPLSESPAG
jgi:hypothetical protein